MRAYKIIIAALLLIWAAQLMLRRSSAAIPACRAYVGLQLMLNISSTIMGFLWGGSLLVLMGLPGLDQATLIGSNLLGLLLSSAGPIVVLCASSGRTARESLTFR